MKSKNLAAVVLSYLIFVVCSIASAQQPVKKAYVPPVEKQRLINGVKLIEDLRYGPIPKSVHDSTSDRILDIYLPERKEQTTKLPVFMFIHGGGFSGGDKGLLDLCSKIAEQGYAVVSINYRLRLKYNKDKEASCSANMSKGLPVNGSFNPLLNDAILEASEDAISALKWIKENGSTYHLDLNKVAVGGGSAGSMTALYVAYVSQQKAVPIKAVVDLWGGLEHTNAIKKDAPPMIIYHGDQDKLINVAYAYALDNRLKEVGSDRSELHIMPGKGHAQYKYIAGNKIQEIAAFLKANL